MGALVDVYHPAYQIPFQTLVDGLTKACDIGHVRERYDTNNGLSLYIYTQLCVYDKGWNEFSVLARGLILDKQSAKIIAAPFPKFFNLGEQNNSLPDEPFEAFEKLDGSLIIVFYHNGLWKTSTKGKFRSSQALWAQKRLDAVNLTCLVPGTTYLFEAIYPENKIVVQYGYWALVMLAAYDATGKELTYRQLLDICIKLECSIALRQKFSSLADLITKSQSLSANEEGFVVRYDNGLRIKIKGAEYCRIHALITRCTPLAMWDAMTAGYDMVAIRRDIPEEFLGDFDEIIRLLQGSIDTITAKVVEIAKSVEHLSNKEIVLSLNTMPKDIRSYLFAFRKNGCIDGKARNKLMHNIRPTGNVLTGYTPSYAINRVIDEAAT